MNDNDLAALRAELRDCHLRQEADLAQVESWEWQRLILPNRNAKRRVRQKVRVSLHPTTGWPCNMGSDRTQPCSSLMQFDAYPHPAGVHWREQWDKDHAGVPVVWAVRTVDKYIGRQHFCRRCLPAEFNPPPEAQVTLGGSGREFHIAAWHHLTDGTYRDI